jgi:hypothetical protein
MEAKSKAKLTVLVARVLFLGLKAILAFNTLNQKKEE